MVGGGGKERSRGCRGLLCGNLRSSPGDMGALAERCCPVTMSFHQRDTASVSPRGNEPAARTAGLTGSTEARYMRAGPELRLIRLEGAAVSGAQSPWHLGEENGTIWESGFWECCPLRLIPFLKVNQKWSLFL